jgi:SAM-dependent MidA family methyltransferase
MHGDVCCCACPILLPLQDAPYEASLQAIRRHEFVGLLEQPGSADLSNRVDYSALRC